MTRRTRAVGALVCALALAAAGCGRDDAGGEAQQGEQVAEGKASGEISVWAMGTEGEKLSTLAEDFMADNPDAKVTVTPVPWDGAHNKIATAIAGGQTPDVSMLGTTWMGEFAKTGALDVVPPDLIDESQFFEGAWQTGVVDETSFGVPWYVETRLLYVNKAVAQKAGVTEAPKTWEDLKAAVTAFKQQGGAEWGIYLQPGQTGAWQTAMPFVWQSGGDVLDGDAFALDRPEVVQGLEYYGSFFSEGLSSKDQLRGGEWEPRFVQGSIGSFVSGPWHIGVLNDLEGEGTYEIWPMPKGPQAATSFIGGSNLAVFKDSDNRDAAWKFVQFLMRPEVQVTWYRTVNDLPAVKSAWDDPALKDDELLSLFGAQLEDAKAPPSIPTWEQVSAAIDGELEKVAKGAASAADAANAMQQKATSIGTGG
ncbi:MAG TPA: sugar ABC transporter substrate-binding protein [Pseudonocardiaceae bacterium]